MLWNIGLIAVGLLAGFKSWQRFQQMKYWSYMYRMPSHSSSANAIWRKKEKNIYRIEQWNGISNGSQCIMKITIYESQYGTLKQNTLKRMPTKSVHWHKEKTETKKQTKYSTNEQNKNASQSKYSNAPYFTLIIDHWYRHFLISPFSG